MLSVWSVREAYESREATQRKKENKSQDFIRCDDVTMGSMWWCVSSGILSISGSVCVRDELYAFSLSLSFSLTRTHSHKRAASEGLAGMECGYRPKACTAAHHTVTTKKIDAWWLVKCNEHVAQHKLIGQIYMYIYMYIYDCAIALANGIAWRGRALRDLLIEPE